MIERDPKYYVTGYRGIDPYRAPFYLRSLVFDGPEGAYNRGLIDEFNLYLRNNDLLTGMCLSSGTTEVRGYMPRNILIINASHDDLPTSYETMRVFRDICSEKGYDIAVSVVNTREELMEAIGARASDTLVVSQCVDKYVYNVDVCEEIESRGAVVVPGKVTAPGGVFSDKDSTYVLLSDNGREWDNVARYKRINVEDRDIRQVSVEILAAVDDLALELGTDTFFVKPTEGGGGLGGFRISIRNGGYIIPDLSKVTGKAEDVHPTFLDMDVRDRNRMEELLWIYRLFSLDDKLSKNYIKTSLDLTGDDAGDMDILTDYVVSCGEKREKKLSGMVIGKNDAAERLSSAITVFEKKFGKRYVPIVNEHIDFGLWGLRAHYRLSGHGPCLETMYHRIFQLAFTEEGVGYLGADNISNKQTGDLEIARLGPLNPVMVGSIGGKEGLFDTLTRGAQALAALVNTLPEDRRSRVPVRVQLDLAAVARRIGEGNADTARGLCLASSWDMFVNNTREWFLDSLDYYAWRKGCNTEDQNV